MSTHSNLTTRGPGKTKQSDDGTHGRMHLMRGCGKGASSEVDSEKGSTIAFFRRLGACWVMVLGRPLAIKEGRRSNYRGCSPTW